MKGVSEDKKPAAKMADARITAPNPLAQADDQETVERIQRQAELDSRNSVKMNKVAKTLDQSYYIQEWTHPCLLIDGRQATVSEYYPEIKVAIDKFYHVGEWEKKITDFKKVALKEQGIKYAYLTPDKTLADIEADLEA